MVDVSQTVVATPFLAQWAHQQSILDDRDGKFCMGFPSSMLIYLSLLRLSTLPTSPTRSP